MKHLNIYIFGRVQGVGFRVSAQSLANTLNITGFIRNEPDGSVYIEAEGEKNNLNKFLDWCKKGPSMARVEKIEFEFTNNTRDFKSFEILYNKYYL